MPICVRPRPLARDVAPAILPWRRAGWKSCQRAILRDCCCNDRAGLYAMGTSMLLDHPIYSPLTRAAGCPALRNEPQGDTARIRRERNGIRMSRTKDLTGQSFGRLVVLRLSGITKHRSAMWLCQCNCGNTSVVASTHLVSNRTKSCGCLRGDGELRRHQLYATWYGMVRRCTDFRSDNWRHYGGRGISVCDRWLHSFWDFVSDVGDRPSPRHTMDRIDNNGNYEPSNVRWSTPKEQCKNKGRRLKTFPWRFTSLQCADLADGNGFQ